MSPRSRSAGIKNIENMKIVPKKHSIVLLLMTLLFAGCGQKAETISNTYPPEIDIHSAATTGDIASVRQHIDAGSDLNEPDSTSGNTPLMNAILFGQQEIGQLLIGHKDSLLL